MFLCVCVSILSVFYSCSGEHVLQHAYSPGDIIIGGLFPIHLKTNRATNGFITCSDYDVQVFLRSQVMIFAIREVNERTEGGLPNITVGYDIYDTCGDVSLAIRATLQLLKPQSDPHTCSTPENVHFALPEPQTKVVIGERYSEVSIAVARIVALSSVAQISYASTSELLSKKFKFPTFLRTISSDEYQTKAIAALVMKFNWKAVAIVGSDDEYGKYGSDSLEDNFNNLGVCVDFIDILPGDFSQNNSLTHERLATLVGKISNSSAEAIIMFTRGDNVDIIMEAVIKSRLNRTWIASDTWSTNTRVSVMPGIELAGQVFGFISKRNEVPGFREYVRSIFNGPTNPILEEYLSHYALCSNQCEEKMESNCTRPDSQEGSKPCLHPCCLTNYIDQDESFNIYLAVQVIVQALRQLLKCDDQRCERGTNFTALELLCEIQKVNFTVNTTHIYFDHNGDPHLGYDVVYWNVDESTQNIHIKAIGEYFPDEEIKLPDDLVQKMRNINVTVYNCSRTCGPGQELKQQGRSCCKDCVPCADGEFSPGNGVACQSCAAEKYSSSLKDKCLKKEDDFLNWDDPFIIILICLSVFGIIMTLVLAVVFTIYRSTPIVKAVGGYLCFLELFSLLICVCIPFTYIGKPTKASCMVGLPLFGVAFSLCISCILANLLQISVGFSFDLRIGSWIKRLNQPMAVVITLSGIQLSLCVPWLHFNPPHPEGVTLTTTILHQCVKGSKELFIAMLCYNAFLALTCFLFAFKGRQLPDLYKNARLLTIGMLLYLIIWILFIPTYVNLKEDTDNNFKYKPAIESAAILVSSHSILCCHLAPKCYIMIFRKEINNENAIAEYIRRHYEQKGMAVVKS